MNLRQDQSNISIMRHSFSHILAQAVLRLYPDTKLGVGPAVENGFYHDFQFSKPIGIEELKNIDMEMRKIIDAELPFQQIFITKDQAFDILHLQGQIYKTEILSQIPEGEVSFFKTGSNFMDLCRGPHVEHTGELGAFKLIGISGVHWNSDDTRPVLQRIHCLAFETEEELEGYIKDQEQKREKDHRILSQKLKLYTFDKINGAGLPIWLPKGTALRKIITDYLYRENTKAGYKYVHTPLLARKELYEKSGDAGKRDNYTFPGIMIDKDEYILRPRALPHHIQIFNSEKRSYRDLPFKIAEFASIFRNEKSGELSGLSRVRSFVNDSNIIICSKDQIKKELIQAISTTTKLYKDFGLKKYKVELALRGQNEEIYEGNIKDWLKLENIIVESVKTMGLTVYEAPNTAERVGPGLNFKFNDVHDKTWQLGSIFFDTRVPNEFKIKYVNSKNKFEEPFVLNRTSIGSLERFFGLLIEQYEGAFPLWLSPTQINIIPISDKYIDYSEEIYAKLIDCGLNVEINKTPETMQNKIRMSQNELIPYMVIIGEKENSNRAISVRPRSGQDLGMMKIEEFVDKVKKEIEEKVIF